jgi:nicotinamide phosphoribosyltransferase
MIKIENLALDTDGYKPSHKNLYPEGTSYLQAHSMSRSEEDREIVFYGLFPLIQALSKYRLTPAHVLEAATIFNPYFGAQNMHAFDKEAWMNLAKLGHIPLHIEALPEGTVTTGRKPLFTIESTHSEFFWLVEYMETFFSRVWYPTTVATNSYLIKRLLYSVLKTTEDSTDSINFMVHDFGSRGVTCREQAEIGGSAALTSFSGTDTIVALKFINDHYGFPANGVPSWGYSIPATEHSVMTIRGRDGERDAFIKLLKTYPKGVVACVSDSYDIKSFIEISYKDEEIRNLILGREGVVVFRPDSGHNPTTILNLFDMLYEGFGGYRASNGRKNLNDKVRIILGDGVDRKKIASILTTLIAREINISNLNYGSGGGLLQKFDRDTYKFAIKLNHAIVNGKGVDVYKEPMEWNEDNEYIKSFKFSHKGLIKDEKLKTVFDNGSLPNKSTFEEIRGRINESIFNTSS